MTAVCLMQGNDTTIFAIISITVVYMSSRLHWFNNLTACFFAAHHLDKTHAHKHAQASWFIISCCENDRKVKSTLTNTAIKPQKATTRQPTHMRNRTSALKTSIIRHPLQPTKAYFSISRTLSVLLLMHSHTKTSPHPILSSSLSHTNAFDVFTESLGA